MTTIGQGSTAKIAGACDDGTVRIYDSVTGALRLSLRPEFPILEMTGVPDGSLLVCTHKGHPFTTLWDIQTGGLVETFILKGEVKRTAVSLKGRYLACETSGNTVNFWETTSRSQHPASCDKFCGNAPCWLAPEELIMIVDWASVCILNVILKGPPVHKFEIPGSVHRAVYSPTSERLAIMSLYFRGGTSFTIFDVKTGTSSNSHSGGERLSSVAFSQTTNELVCSGKAPGLETVDISTGRRTRFNFPATVTSVLTLSNGTVVANVRGSGIQLLSLGQERDSPRQPTPPPLAMYPLDKGRIVAIVPEIGNHVVLLDVDTMESEVLSTPTRQGRSVATDYVVVLCASLGHMIAALCSKKRAKYYLEMWEFRYGQQLRWAASTEGLPSVGSISPSGTRLVTFHSGSSQSFVRVWGAYNGALMAWMYIDNPHVLPPIDITFDSEDLFYFYDSTHREPHVIDTESWTNGPDTYSITRRAKEQLNERVSERCYSLDDGHEWAICDSQRICWIPPGYVGSSQVNHCWAGSSLVMVGQDGTLRRLTFLDSSL